MQHINVDDAQAAIDAINRLREEGVLQAKSGNYGVAAEKFSAALRFLPEDFKLNLDRGYALFYSKRYDEAFHDAEKAFNLRISADALHLKGLCLHHLGRLPEAQECLTNALKLSPNNEEISLDLQRTNTAMRNRNEHKTRRVHDVSDDFECVLCMKLYYQPVTTPCGHTFCKGCLIRSLDHKPSCPMCREALHFSTEHPVNITLQNIIKNSFPAEYEQRKREEDRLITQNEANMPLFVLNTVAVPGQSFPLHIFEPRYRLMMRRCMAGDKLFGLIGAHRDDHGAWKMNEYGTVLKINDFKLLPDGRSYVGTVATLRFRVLDTWICDGYNAGRVEYVHDSPKDNRQVSRELEMLNEIVNALRQLTQNPEHLDGALRNFSTYIQSNLHKIPQNPDEASWWLLAMLPQNVDDSDQPLRSRSTLERLQQTKALLEEITAGQVVVR